MNKILFSPFFGPLPSWIGEYRKNCEKLEKYGWDIVVLNDLYDFVKRIRRLGIEPNIPEGTCKASDFRPALGLLYADKLKDYDFWGYTDLDCVYGRLDKYITDKLLSGCDIFSNDIDHMCGPMSLYRNTKKVNNLFKEHPQWGEIALSPIHNAFDEVGISEVIHKHPELRVEYHHWEGHDPNDPTHLTYKDGLFDGKDEIMYFHFNRLKPKVWPLK